MKIASLIVGIVFMVFVGHRSYYLSDPARCNEKRHRSGVNDGGDSVSRTVFCGVGRNNRFGDICFEIEKDHRAIARSIN